MRPWSPCGRLILVLLLSGCSTRIDVSPARSREREPPPELDGLALGPASLLYPGGGGLEALVAVGSDGSSWAIVSSGGEVLHGADAQSIGTVWPLADAGRDVSVAGTSEGFYFVWTTADGSVQLVYAPGDGAIVEELDLPGSSDAGESRGVLAPGGASVWLAVESCPDAPAPGCLLRAYRVSLDARANPVTEVLCDGCTDAPDGDAVAAGSMVLAGGRDGAVIGWRDAAALRFRSLRAPDEVGPVVTARDLSEGDPVLDLAVAAHGSVASVAWSAGADLRCHRVELATGALSSSVSEPCGSSEDGEVFLAPLGEVALVVTRTNSENVALRLGPQGPPQPFPWNPQCYPITSAAGPAGRTQVLCNAWTVPGVLEVSAEGAFGWEPDYAQKTTLERFALACDALGCSVATQRAAQVSLAPWFPETATLGPQLPVADFGLGGVVRSAGMAFVAATGMQESSPSSIVSADAEAGRIAATIDARPLAMAPSREPGAVLFAQWSESSGRLELVRFRGEGREPLSSADGEPAGAVPCRGPWSDDCWLRDDDGRGNVALAASDGGVVLAWLDGRGRLRAALASNESAALSASVVLAEPSASPGSPAAAMVDGVALVTWMQAGDSGAGALRAAAIAPSSPGSYQITTPVPGAARDPRIVPMGHVALLAWQVEEDDVRLARLDGQGRGLDPTGSDALTLADCAPFDLAAVDARRAVISCQQERGIWARFVFLPERPE